MKNKNVETGDSKTVPEFCFQIPTLNQVRRLLFYLSKDRERFLTHREEVILIYAIRNNMCKSRCMDEMVHRNMGLCRQAANSVRGREFYNDAVASAMQGVLTAIERFDPTRGFRFSTLAHQWCAQKVNRSRVNYERMIRIPEHMVYKATTIKRTMDLEHIQPNGTGDIEDLAMLTGLTSETVMLALKTISLEPTSLDQPLSSTEANSSSLIHIIKSDETIDRELMIRDQDAQIMEMLSFLEPDTKMMLILHYGLCGTEVHTFGDLSNKFGMSKQATEQRVKRAIKAIKAKGYKEIDFSL